MKKLITLSCLLILFSYILSAQIPTFVKTIKYSDDAHGKCVRQTTDGGFIIAGYTFNSDSVNTDALIVKTNYMGDTTWTKHYGGNGEYDDQEAKSIIETGNGYMYTGVDWVTSGSYGLYLMNINSSGTTLWEKTHKFSLDMNGNDIIPAQGGGYATAGYYGAYSYFSYIMLNKYDTNGDTAWSKLYNFSGSMAANSLRAPDAAHGYGYIILGNIYINGSYDMYVIRTNDNGDTLWTKNYGGINDEYGNCIQQTSDGGYILAGYQENANGYYNTYVIKINSSGNIQWEKSLGIDNNDERGRFILQTSDNGYVIAGDMHTPSNYDDVFIMKLNTNGDSLWTKIYGFASYDNAQWMDQTTDGGFIITGNAMVNYDDVILLVKTDANGNAATDVKEPPVSDAQINVSPNPFSKNTTISLQNDKPYQNASCTIYNTLGEKINTLQFDKNGRCIFDSGNLPRGLYLGSVFIDNAPVKTIKILAQ